MADDDRSHFNLPDDRAYFNCAAIGPLPRAAQEAIAGAAARHGQPWLIDRSDWVEAVEERRTLFAALAGTDAEAIALVPSVSYGLAVAARNLAAARGQCVLVPADDFPSGIYTWRAFAARTGCEIRTVSRAAEQSWTEAVLAAIDERVAVVAMPNVHWTDGGLFDLAAIAARARDVGAKLAVDASQSFGVLPLDLAKIRPDFLACVGYKWLLGPYGLSYLYVAPEQRDGAPIEENWLLREGAEDFARLVDYQDRYLPGARRFDSGQRSAFELTGAASASLRLIAKWRVSRISRQLGEITGWIEAEALNLGLRATSGPQRCPHLLGLRLSAEQSDRARALFAEARVDVAFRGASVRIAPHMYTTDEDVERLIGALERIAAAA